MSECVGEGCTHSSHSKVLPPVDQPYDTGTVLNEKELDGFVQAGARVSLHKVELHRKMRRLGMGKHAAGNAHTLANHSRVPGEVLVADGKTKAQFKAELRAAKKRKNKMARQSRKRNRH